MSLWPSGLGRGLQNLLHWFESNWGLKILVMYMEYNRSAKSVEIGSIPTANSYGEIAQWFRARSLQGLGRGFESLSPYKCSDGGTGRHDAFKPHSYGVRVRVPLGVQMPLS